MGPCAICNRQLLETGLPIFNRFTVQQCGIDGSEVRKHVGLAMQMGGGVNGLALAGVLGPRVEPVVEVVKHQPVNICHDCGLRTDVPIVQLLDAIVSAQTPDNDRDEEPEIG